MKILLVVLLSLILCGAALGDAPPCWPPPSYVMERQWHNVLDYGAVGDDSTLNDVAFLAAIDSAGDKGIVFVPSGTYLLSDTLALGDSMIFFGVGVASVIKADSGHNENIITITDKTGARICDLMINGNNANNDSVRSAIIFEGCTDFMVSNVKIVNMYGQSIGVGTEGNPSNDGVIEHCKISGGTSNHIDVNSSQNVRILNNTITGTMAGEDGIFLGHGLTEDHLVMGNKVDSANIGISASNNMFSTDTSSVRRLRIIGNSLGNNQNSGVVFWGVSHSMIANNESWGNNTGGPGGSGILLTDGYPTDASSPYDDTVGSTHNVIIGNRCYDTANVQMYGLQSIGKSDSNYVSGNDFQGNNSGTYSLVGTNFFATYADTAAIHYGHLWVSPTWAPEIQTYNAGQNAPLIVRADSVQLKLIEQHGKFKLWIGDSAFSTGIEWEIAGPAALNLPYVRMQSDTTRFRGNVIVDSPLTIGAYKFPMVDGTAGYVLETNGSGALSWQPNDTSGTPQIDSFYVLFTILEAGGWMLCGDTIKIDTTSDSLYVKCTTSTVEGWKHGGDTLFQDTTGGTGEINTLSDTGTFNGTEGFGLAGGKTGTALKVKGLIEGSNITIAASGDSAYTITGSAGGSGTTDSTYINTGVQYGPFTNNMYKIKESASMNITREDSATYDVFKFHATLGTSISDGEIDANTIDTSSMAHAPLGKLIRDTITDEGYITDSKFSDSSITLLNATAWRLFYSNATTTAIQELILGGDGTYLKSNGASAAPTWATPGGAGWNWTDSTGFLVGWGGVAKSVVNDTNYFRFEGSADFDTTGGSVSLADDAVDPVVLKDSNVQAQGDIVTVAASSEFGFKTVGELALMEDEDINTFTELQSWVSDKTLVNEEDIFTIDANWVNTANPWADNEVSNDITITEASDVDTTGTKISAALADRLDDLLSDVYKYFDRTYFDTLIDASGDSIICAYCDSTDLSIFDTDDLAEGTNKYETFDSSAAKIRAKTISKAAPTDNYVMKYDAALDSVMWEADVSGGSGWNWVDSAGEPPFWVDSAKHADSAYNADSLGHVAASSYLTSETDPIWVSDSGDYAFKTWVQIEVEDSLNEYSLTSAIIAGYLAKADSGTWKEISAKTVFNQIIIGNASDTGVTDSNAATRGYVEKMIGDSLNEYSLTSAITSLYFDTAETVDTVQGLLVDYVTDANLTDTLNSYPDTATVHDSLDVLRAEMDDSVTTTNVNAAGAVMESDFNATTFLYATTDNTPQPKTPAETRAILNVEDGATADQTDTEVLDVLRDSLWGAITVGGGAATTLSSNYVDSTHVKPNALSLSGDMHTFTEAELQTALSNVTNVFTNNDGALNDDDVTAADLGNASANIAADGTIEWEDATDLDANGALNTGCVADNEIDYANVTFADFDYQTAWQSFYSNAAGDVTELAFGTNGKVLTSSGVSSAPTWEIPSAAWNWDDSASDGALGPYWVDSAKHADSADHSDTADYATNAGGLDDPFIPGDLTYTGSLIGWQRRGALPTLDVFGVDLPDTGLQILVHTWVVADTGGLPLDSIYCCWDDSLDRCTAALHPSVVWADNGVFGDYNPQDTDFDSTSPRGAMVFTPSTAVSEHCENPCILGTHGKDTTGTYIWQSWGTDTTQNPIITPYELQLFCEDTANKDPNGNDYSGYCNWDYFSDATLFPAHGKHLWMAFRAITDSNPCYETIWLMSTDGSRETSGDDSGHLAWSDPTMIFVETLTTSDAHALSPFFIQFPGGKYRMWLTYKAANAPNYMRMYETDGDPDAEYWAYLDSSYIVDNDTLTYGIYNRELWHPNAKMWSGNQLLGLFCYSTWNGSGDHGIVYIAQSDDGGYTWRVREEPFIVYSDNIWFDQTIYRSDFWWNYYADGTVTMDVFYSGRNTNGNWDIGHAESHSITDDLPLTGGALTGPVTTTSTFDTVDVATLAAKVHKDSSHFIFAFSNPNSVYDTDSLLCIKPVTEKAITITRIDVTCDADPATEPAMKLSHTDNFISRTTPTTIDVITTTNGVTTITSGFDDATIPASRCIYFAFTADPIAAIKSITVDITYTVD